MIAVRCEAFQRTSTWTLSALSKEHFILPIATWENYRDDRDGEEILSVTGSARLCAVLE